MYARKITITALVVVSFIWGSPTSAHVAVGPEGLVALGLQEGNIVGASVGDPDVYIVNEWGYKRLFLSPAIFGFYGHLRFSDVRRFPDTVIVSMPTTGYFRNCETGDQKVYGLQVNSEDSAVLRWVNVSGEIAVAEDADFFKKVFCINNREFQWYTKGAPFTSFAQVPLYERTALPPAGANTTGKALNIPSGFRASLFTPSAVGPLRMMAFSPDGILFTSISSRAGLYGGSAGTDGVVYAMPDRNGDGIADESRAVLSGLHLPHGLAFWGGFLYVAEEGTVSRYQYLGNGSLGTRTTIIGNLPTGGEHKSRTIAFSPEGKLYVSIGSVCNNCATSDNRTASVWEYNADGTGGRVYATGIRNAVGLSFSTSGALWATENSRDYLGDNLPPDEINILQSGGFYGWPRCYGARVVDSAFNDAASCAASVGSAHNLQAHSAPLGMAFVKGSLFPSAWSGDLLVARHGSWNRTQPVGYDVVRLNVEGNSVVGEEPFITGWLTSDNRKIGRPVDVVFGPDGALYITDDMANVVYRITAVP